MITFEIIPFLQAQSYIMILVTVGNSWHSLTPVHRHCACTPLCLAVDYGPSGWPCHSEPAPIGSLPPSTARLHLFLIGCHSLPCLPSLPQGGKLKRLSRKTRSVIERATGSGIAIGEGRVGGGIFISLTCLLRQMLFDVWGCSRNALMEGCENTRCSILTPFHWSSYLCMFSLQP